jgi:hypothetical protein
MAKIYAPSVFTAFMLFLAFTVHAQIPAPPAVSGDTTICVGDTVHLTATHPNQNVTFSWWSAAVGGTQLSNTYFLNTGVLNSTTTFYAQVALGSDISTRTPLIVTTIATAPNINLTVADTIYTCNFAPVTVGANTTTPGCCSKMVRNFWSRKSSTRWLFLYFHAFHCYYNPLRQFMDWRMRKHQQAGGLHY